MAKDWMRAKTDQDDTETLQEIVAALREIGSQLDAADKLRGHDPWPAIARQETRIRSLAARLSDRFCDRYPDLVQRLAASANLHLVWGSLSDEVKQAIRQGKESLGGR
jgi:hypothetical protein